MTQERLENLKTLTGAPQTVGGNFNCSYCHSLENLQGGPAQVKGWYGCFSCNSLKSLHGAPETTDSHFDCFTCDNLTSLMGAPRHIGGNFSCEGCVNLRHLEGSPQTVGGAFNCSCTGIESLQGSPQTIGRIFSCDRCVMLTSLDHVGTCQVLIFRYVKDISPELVQQFLENQVKLVADQEEPWIHLVNDYYSSSDLITAIAQYEDYFKVPFRGTITTSTSLPDVPTL